MRYVTAALVVAVLFLSMQLHTAKERIAVLEDRSTVYHKHNDNFEQFLGFVQKLIELHIDQLRAGAKRHCCLSVLTRTA